MDDYSIDRDSDSVIHQDSESDDFDNNKEEDVMDEDAVDIGFRFQYGRKLRSRIDRARNKDDATYGIFLEAQNENKKFKRRSHHLLSAPAFVSAKKDDTPEISAAKQDHLNAEGRNDDTKLPNRRQAETMQEVIEEEEMKITNRNKPKTQIKQEDKEEEEKQRAADAKFNALLKKGRGAKRDMTNNASAAIESVPTSLENNGLGMPASFGGLPATDKPPPQIDPNLGKWEKHTKGFGMKMLAKMGYKGSGGLGSNRGKRKMSGVNGPEQASTTASPTNNAIDEAVDSVPSKKGKTGISRPIEVVVRPTSLGLGYGNFREATQLKVNRAIEAEVRGLELPEEEDKKEKSKERKAENFAGSSKSSSLPTTKELLDQKQWKHKKRASRQEGTRIVRYTELLKERHGEGDQPVIVDMRGPSEEANNVDGGEPPLAEELLHNVSFLLNTFENKIHSSSHFAKSAERKCDSLKSDVLDMQNRQSECLTRTTKLQKVLSGLGEFERVTQQFSANEYAATMLKVQRLLQELEASFSVEDRRNLQFWKVVAPSLMSPLIQSRLDNWDPLGDLSTSKEIIKGILTLGSEKFATGDQESIVYLRGSIFQNQLLPRVKQALELVRWQPTRDVDVGLNLFEIVYQCAMDAEPKQEPLTHEPEENGHVLSSTSTTADSADINLAELAKEVLVNQAVYSKLLISIRGWKPTIERHKNNLDLRDRLDLWTLPWIPYLDFHSKIPTLISSCTKKLASTITHLQRKVSDDMEFLQTCIQTLRPWQRAVEADSMKRLTSTTTTARLARHLSKQHICCDANDQDWSGLHILVEMHVLHLLSDTEYVSLVEELLTRWASKMHECLLHTTEFTEVARSYQKWKVKTMISSAPTSNSQVNTALSRSAEFLRKDEAICGIFHSVLKMIVASRLSQSDILRDLHPPGTNFHDVVGRRAKEKQRKVQDARLRMESRDVATEVEARIRLQRRNVASPTFRDVVEELAKECQVEFHPRLTAQSVDGKQTYAFGKVNIYFAADVVFAFRDATWNPVSLDELVSMAKEGL